MAKLDKMNIIKNKKVVYFGDDMLSMSSETIEAEFDTYIKSELESKGLEFDNVKCTTVPPFGENYDILFFDWGGMSLGNDMLGSFCRLITREAKDRPNTYYVMTSTFTKYAMEDALDGLSGTEKLHNVFLNIPDFSEFYKKYELSAGK